MPRSRRLGAGLLAVSILLLAAVPGAAQEPSPRGERHDPPVEAPLLDPFRPPSSPFGPGNRGLLYGTDPGVPVTATADGVVVFAGLVGGTRHVTVRHGSGVRTSYSFLARIQVVVGQRVERGQVLGTTAGPFHLGARLGDAYFDPATLFDRPDFEVQLVPFDLPLGVGADGERGAIRALVNGLGRLGRAAVDRVLEASGADLAWLQARGVPLLRALGHYAVPLPLRLAAAGHRIWTDAQAVARRPCTPPGTPVSPPARRRVAIAVPGLGSTSEAAGVHDIDYEGLGYDLGDVVGFSYRGGRVPGRGANLAVLPATTYDRSDTQQDLLASAELLADLIEQAADAVPGVVIDLFAHSQGGIVARLALARLEERHGAPWLAHIDEVILLATPNQGADLATGLFAFGSTERGSQILDAAGAVAGLDDDAPSVVQLSETSAVVRQLVDRPLPEAVDAVTIGARGDPVVALPRTHAPGALPVAVPLQGATAHGDLPGSPEAHREMALALADRPPTCRSLSDALIDGAVGEGISLATDQLSSLAWLWAAGRSGGKPLGG